MCMLPCMYCTCIEVYLHGDTFMKMCLYNMYIAYFTCMCTYQCMCRCNMFAYAYMYSMSGCTCTSMSIITLISSLGLFWNNKTKFWTAVVFHFEMVSWKNPKHDCVRLEESEPASLHKRMEEVRRRKWIVTWMWCRYVYLCTEMWHGRVVYLYVGVKLSG